MSTTAVNDSHSEAFRHQVTKDENRHNTNPSAALNIREHCGGTAGAKTVPEISLRYSLSKPIVFTTLVMQPYDCLGFLR